MLMLVNKTFSREDKRMLRSIYNEERGKTCTKSILTGIFQAFDSLLYNYLYTRSLGLILNFFH